MREKTRQSLLQAGEAMTAKQAAEIIRTAKSTSWCGCLSGNGWKGTRVWLNGRLVSAQTHHQNNAPTGYETTGTFEYPAKAVLPATGDRLTIGTPKSARKARVV